LTRTVPSPDTLFALIVMLAVAAPALLAALGELALGELALDELELAPLLAPADEPEDPVLPDEPHAATVMAPAEIRPTPSSRRADEAEWGRTVIPTRETLL
jgi:hypothetical protein